MLAALQERYGPPEVVRLAEVDRPVPGDDGVLVRVQAASVNRADLDGLGPRPGFVRLFLGLRAPRNHRTGIDVAGVVDSVGASVTRFKPGDKVFADLYPHGGGAFAEFACAPEKAFQSMPADMSFEDAATLPHSAILALQGLRRRRGGTIKAGDKVAIVGASGNVGPFAVQIAKSMGAEVTGVARTNKLDFVRSLGADHVIDYTRDDFTKLGERYDRILDMAATRGIADIRRALTKRGVYIVIGGSLPLVFGTMLVGFVMPLAGKQRAGLPLWKPFNSRDAAELSRMLADGIIKPVIDRRYPLSEVPDALRHVDDRHAKGKVVITVQS